MMVSVSRSSTAITEANFQRSLTTFEARTRTTNTGSPSHACRQKLFISDRPRQTVWFYSWARSSLSVRPKMRSPLGGLRERLFTSPGRTPRSVKAVPTLTIVCWSDRDCVFNSTRGAQCFDGCSWATIHEPSRRSWLSATPQYAARVQSAIEF
ncbi:hypothetical protein BJV74DRAFT_133481 [Russula compacta]|nr:hypothetical protein BJV74DRAFT_133481 [Russula compacta]